MNVPFPSDKLQRFHKLSSEYLSRVARDLQSKRGWYDEDGVRQGGLIAFVRYFWHVLEPETPFVDGWPLHAIAEHLEAVTFGEITRLLINVPPGFAKSIIVDCFWPAWEWGPMKKTHYRYVAFSYSASLTERDNDRFRTLVTSDVYQKLYGPFRTSTKTEQETVEERDAQGTVSLRNKTTIKVINTRTGWKLASSVGGVATGERGDRVICIPYKERVLSDQGWLPIGEIVDRRLPVRVLGCDKDGSVSWQVIGAYEVNRSPRQIVEIVAGGVRLRCTNDHPVYVESRGFIRADRVQAGETVWTFGVVGLSDVRQGGVAQAERATEILQPTVSQRGLDARGARQEQPPVQSLRHDGLSASSTSGSHAGRIVLQPQMPRDFRGRFRQPNVEGWGSNTGLPTMRQAVSGAAGAAIQSRVLFPVVRDYRKVGQWWVSFCARAAATVRGVWEVLQAAQPRYADRDMLAEVSSAASFATYAWQPQRSLSAWGSNPSLPAWMDKNAQGANPRTGWWLLSGMWSRKNRGSEPSRPPHRLREGEPGREQSDYGLPLVSRHDARQPETARRVDRAIVETVRNIGIENTTYNLRVGPDHTYFAEGILVHNCDDPHSVLEAESERIRSETVRWFRESISSRFNNLATGALVIIMQRVHYDDISGVALGEEFDYCHLMIPWEFDPHRAFVDGELIENKIGWSDPRADPDDPDANAGEPAWPERFRPEDIARLRSEGGPYMWAAQYNQAPVPRGEGIFKREWWQLWESPNNRYPEFEYIIASLDGAFTSDEENDPSAMTVWGVFTTQDGKRAIMLIRAWRKHLQFSAKRVEKNANETHGAWRQRTQASWGLMEWVYDTCTWLNGRPMQVDKLLIEAKASGISAAQELQNRYSIGGFAIQLCQVKGDKVARAYAVQPTFSNGLVYAPEFDWSEMVIEEAEMFPRGKYDDLTDSMTQALRYLRDAGLAQTDEELVVEERERGMHKPRRGALYQV